MEQLFSGLFLPLLRLLCGLLCGLFVANLLEALHWTRPIARVALPFARAAHLGETSAASFPISFISSASANALLGEAYTGGRLSRRELMLANLFNSLPAYLLHTPTIFLLTWPVLGTPALTYVGLTLAAAALRTGLTLAAARRILPAGGDPAPACAPDTETAPEQEGEPAARNRKHAARQKETGGPFVQALRIAGRRFLRRVPKLVAITVPVYILVYCLHTWGAFDAVQAWLGAHAGCLAFLRPEALGIVALHMVAELGAALGSAGSALYNGGLSAHEVVLALLAGNILSTPVRALRHQLPSYAAYYAPRTALLLICASQGLRAASMTLVAVAYAFWG